jgi:hypothetical protein
MTILSTEGNDPQTRNTHVTDAEKTEAFGVCSGSELYNDSKAFVIQLGLADDVLVL